MVTQHIIEDGKTRNLKEFVDQAIDFLEKNLEYDEVVQLADNITELKNDKISFPTIYYKLPQGYEYNFSGFLGQVLGIGYTGIRNLHRNKP